MKQEQVAMTTMTGASQGVDDPGVAPVLADYQLLSLIPHSSEQQLFAMLPSATSKS